MSNQVIKLRPRWSWLRRHKFLVIRLAVAGVVVVVIIASVATGTSTITTSGTASLAVGGTASPAASTGGAGIGDTVKDGKFAFTITRVSHGTADGMGGHAQGLFTILNVRVRNIGSEARMPGG